MKATPFQQMVLAIPEQYNVMLAGGRGGGKSGAIKLLILKHCEKYKSKAKVLFIRETLKSASEVEDELDILFKQAYGKKTGHNRSEHQFRLPNGASVEIGYLESSTDYSRYQGRSYTFLVIDEAGLLKSNKWIALLKTNLRAEPGIPLQEVRAANPAGTQHAYIHRSFILAAPEGQPFDLEGETWVCIKSTFRDNPHLDHSDYEKRMRAAANGDEALAKAWIDGDWNVARGAMFSGVLDEKVHRINIQPDDANFNLFEFSPSIALDWGTARPSVVYLCLRSHGEFGYPPGSLILLDEVASHAPNDLNEGLYWPPGKLAEAVTEMCSAWGLKNVPSGIGDDAYGLDESLLKVLERHGIYLQLPNKTRGSRVSGWAKMRELFHNAKERNGKPGMWVNARCNYFWATLPFLPRDPDRPEDIMSNGPDHGADAARYAVLKNIHTITTGTTCGS